ncbi:MAG: hypothetical protein ACLFPN_01290 [Methanomassiliicoccales archaeon]
MPSLEKGDLEQEYEDFSDPTWKRTGIMEEGDTRFFLAWLQGEEELNRLVEVLRGMCPSLRCLFEASHRIQELGDSKAGHLEAWLETRICVATRGSHGPSCFTLRMDPGSLQGRVVSTPIISPEGYEVGYCVFEL